MFLLLPVLVIIQLQVFDGLSLTDFKFFLFLQTFLRVLSFVRHFHTKKIIWYLLRFWLIKNACKPSTGCPFISSSAASSLMILVAFVSVSVISWRSTSSFVVTASMCLFSIPLAISTRAAISSGIISLTCSLPTICFFRISYKISLCALFSCVCLTNFSFPEQVAIQLFSGWLYQRIFAI